MISPIEISSQQNPQVKRVIRLRQERFRKKAGKVLIDGRREIRRAVENGYVIDEIYCCRPDENRELLEMAQPSRLYVTSESVFSRVAFGDRNEGLVAVATEKPHSLKDIKKTENALLLILDGIEKPGNVGAVFRTASAAGVDAIILTNAVSVPYNANSIRSSLGTVFEVPFAIATVEETVSYLQRHEIGIVVTRVDGELKYTEYDFSRPVAIVLGSEAEGVATSWHAHPSITIPMRRSVDSLNISATAAILAYEATRQRPP